MSIAPFSIGISTAPPEQSMDMSLDEIIAARRKSADTTSPKNNRRKSLKSTTGSASKKDSTKKTQNVQKALGTNRAKRNAKTAAKRGITNKTKPDPKSVEKEVYRLQRRGGRGAAGGIGSRTQPRRSTRIRDTSNNNKENNNNRNTGRSAADRKIKAKNTARNNNVTNNNRNNNTKKDTTALQAPSKKAFNAAVKAMNNAGYQAPKGMKMVISFAPTENKNTNNKKNNTTRTNNNRRGQNPRGRKN